MFVITENIMKRPVCATQVTHTIKRNNHKKKLDL